MYVSEVKTKQSSLSNFEILIMFLKFLTKSFFGFTEKGLLQFEDLNMNKNK